jgi:predicted ribonuclease YlaK
VIDYISTQDNIVLSAKVIDELDRLKVTLDDESKRKVEAALRHINSKYNERSIRMEFADLNYLPSDFNRKNPDNFILSIAVKYRNQNPILLTSDNGFQVKAKGLGIPTLSINDFIRNHA